MNKLRLKWKNLNHSERLRWKILLFLISFGLGISAFSLLSGENISAFGLNLGTELIGAVITYWLLAQILERSEQREIEIQAEKKLKAALISQLKSQLHEDVIRAVEQLRRRGWLEDGTLRLCILANTLLEGAYLMKADLHGTVLEGAKLQNAKLQNANLSEAYLVNAKLTGADLRGANLKTADLRNADLHGVKLDGTQFDITTTLPDGRMWSPEVDMTDFTIYKARVIPNPFYR